MKPALITQDFSGQNNQNLPYLIERQIKQGHYKRQRIVVVIPTIEAIHPKVYLTHLNLLYPLNNPIRRMLAVGMEVGAAYESAFQAIVADQELVQWEYVLTLEADNMPPHDGILKLLEHMEAHPEYSAIGGLYFYKGPHGVAQIWGDPKDQFLNFRPQPPDLLDGLVECCGLGMGFTLFRMELFRDKKIGTPWFKTNDGVYTQDLYFWAKAKPLGYRCAVACDVRVGHYEQKTDRIW